MVSDYRMQQQPISWTGDGLGTEHWGTAPNPAGERQRSPDPTLLFPGTRRAKCPALRARKRWPPLARSTMYGLGQGMGERGTRTHMIFHRCFFPGVEHPLSRQRELPFRRTESRALRQARPTTLDVGSGERTHSPAGFGAAPHCSMRTPHCTRSDCAASPSFA